MAKCGYCGSTILFGGKRSGKRVFCNDECRSSAKMTAAADTLPQAELEREVRRAYRSSCRVCGGPGPVDIHTSYRVWSALVLTRQSSRTQVCCSSCGLKMKLGDLGFSAALGWWGVPWGLLYTPFVIIGNLIGIIGGPRKGQPSDSFREYVRMKVGSRRLSSPDGY